MIEGSLTHCSQLLRATVLPYKQQGDENGQLLEKLVQKLQQENNYCHCHGKDYLSWLHLKLWLLQQEQRV